ncbi:carbon-nitrogen hydrolase family protein [Pseudomonas sp. UBA4194]|uniref:carbon-nitrogen hydrolase family protein n=1 Tax=Pseudomonas sp. UBA4194 TaxID=1947317 RepID=UPI0025CEDDDB|nr:carbon-nitrogen hydrolase family protein [Pseudomonas sp. UBA4194]
MKLIAAQIASIPGNIQDNLAKHVRVIHQAAGLGGSGIFFPELSLSGYQPALAGALAMHASDPRLDEFQGLSDRYRMLIAIGLPIKARQGIEIGMVVFQPGVMRTTYCKQHLHADETPFFIPASGQQVFDVAGHMVAPAICYESLQTVHAQEAAAMGAQIYFTSVAKSERGVAAACAHYPLIARQHGFTVLMANCVGPADDYVGAGQSAVWNTDGELAGRIDSSMEGLVVYDPGSGEVAVHGLG